MTAKIYIALNPIGVSEVLTNHTYLVYDADGNENTTNDQLILRGGASADTAYEFIWDSFFDPGDLVVEAGRELALSADGLHLDKNGDGQPDTPADRHYTGCDRSIPKI